MADGDMFDGQVMLTGGAALRTFAAFYADPIDCVEKIYAACGPRSALKAPFLKPKDGPQSHLFVGPDYNKAVLLNQEHLRPTGAWPVPGPEGSTLQNLRHNILCMHGREHDAYMKGVVPQLSQRRMAALFGDVKKIIADELRQWPQGDVFDVVPFARGLTQRLSFELLFGAGSKESALDFGALVDEFHQHCWRRSAMIFRIDAPLTPYRQLMRAAQSLEDAAAAWADAKNACPIDSSLTAAIANITMDDGAPIPLRRAAANIAAIGMASYETTALTLSWALFLLTQHPDALKALQAEADDAPGFDAITADDINTLPMLNGVVNETMRLITPVPIIGFVAVEPCEIAGTAVVQNARIFIAPHLTHRMEAVYDRPREFRPERWRAINPSAYEYLPFNAGPRRCPGIWFATANLKAALLFIAKEFNFALARKARIDRGYAATTVSLTGIPVKLGSRNETINPEPCAGTIRDFIDLPAAGNC